MTSWKKIITSGSSAELSSLIIENVPSASTGQSVLTYDVNSGRIYKTGSYGGAEASDTASLALSGGKVDEPFYVNNNCFISGGLTVSGNFSPAGGVTITDTSVDNFTNNTIFQGTVDIAGITKLGTSSANTVNHEITGNLVLSASAGITANMPSNTVGFHGTSSHAYSSSHTLYASESISSSYALTASHASNASLPTDPTFTTLTTTGTTNLAGPLTVENGSVFNSGVTVNGGFNVRKLKISSSLTKIFFINESSVNIQGGVESIVEFGPKPGSENHSIINIVSSKDYSKGLRFTETNSSLVASIESKKDGIITISGSGHLNAGQVNFEGKRAKFECPITASSIITEGELTAAAGIKATNVTSTGGVNCSNLMVLAGATFFGDISVTTLTSGEKLSIAANTGNITSSGHLKIEESITCKKVSASKGFTGSLLGTSSFAVSSSHTYLSHFSSHSFNSATAFSASYASSSTSASYASSSTSASYALTASFLNTSVLSASYASSSTSASYALSSTSASYASSSTSASYASSSTSASYALSSTSADESQKIRFNNDTQLLESEFYIPYADNNTGQKSLFANTDFRFNPSVNSLSTTSSHAVTASHATTASFALNAEGGGLWFDGTTYWSSSLQADGSPTKIGIGKEPTLYSLEVNGTMAATQDVIAFMGSDKRLKDNIKPIENPIDKIKQIGGYTFDWNNNQNVYQGSDVGVIAQEIEKVLPSLVQTRDDGYKGVKYDKIVTLLIEAIKDQQKQIDELKKLI